MSDIKQSRQTKSEQKTSEAWTRLFETAEALYSCEPWEIFSEMDVAEVVMPDGQTYYCCISGMFEDEKAVSVYIGEKGLVSLSSYVVAVEVPDYIAQSRRKCMECSWGPRLRLRKHDHDIVKLCDRHYRGPEAWPLFRSYDPGFEPWYLTDTQAELLANVFEGLTAALTELESTGELNQLLDGDRIRRCFDKETLTWKNEILSPIERIEAYTDGCLITDELLIRRLKKKKTISSALEYDILYLPVSSQRRSGTERRALERLAVLCDADGLELKEEYLLESFDDPRDIGLGMLIDYMENNGRPSAIYVRDGELYGIIGHLCKSIDVPVYFTDSLCMVDYFVEGILDELEDY